MIFSQYQTLNFAFSMMTIMAKALEMGKYHEYLPMLDVVYAEKNVTETYKIAK